MKIKLNSLTKKYNIISQYNNVAYMLKKRFFFKNP